VACDWFDELVFSNGADVIGLRDRISAKPGLTRPQEQVCWA
jgi:hypothetical protein